MSQSSTQDAEHSDPIRGYSEPDRFWTTANTGEAVPAVMKPLDWSLWGPCNHLGSMRAWHSFGLVPDDLVTVPADQNQWVCAIFYGRFVVNVDLVRAYYGRFPGMDPDEYELSISGSVRPEAYRPPAWAPAVADQVAARVADLRDSHDGRVSEHATEYRAWWTDRVSSGVIENPFGLMEDSYHRFERAIEVHNQTRLLSISLISTMYQIAERAGQVEAVPAVFAAFGQVDEIGMADDLWEYAQGSISRAAFVARHGYHGENEGNPSGRAWREDFAPLEGVAQALSRRDGYTSPRDRMRAALEEQSRALTTLEADLSVADRDELNRVLSAAGPSIRQTELGKAAFLMAIDGFRAGARAVGAELSARGILDEADDVFFLTFDELRLVRDPVTAGSTSGDDVRSTVERRRQSWRSFLSLDLPPFFTGMPVPDRATHARAAAGEAIIGTPVSAGTVEGRVRVLRRSESDAELEPGDVLVCASTDPSWTPLLMMASAVVIDIGGVASHGAIVARELGIPAVASTGDGSHRLRDGDLVRVDGASGAVTVLAVAESRESVDVP